MRSFVDTKKTDKKGRLIIKKEAKEISPVDLDSSLEAIDRVKKKEGVMLNFDGIPVENAQRTLDFISGAAYTLGAELKKVRGNKYLLVPQGVKVDKVREEN